MVSPAYPINVKIPKFYVTIIDENLAEGKPLRRAGYKGRAHFVREAVKEKLIQMEVITREKVRMFEEQYKRKD